MHREHLRAAQSDSLFSLEEIDEIPSSLAGVWAYIKWEADGRPSRSQEEADEEYHVGLLELQQCLCRGKTLDELWAVANGEAQPYAEFKRTFIDAARRAGGSADSAVAVEAPPPPPSAAEVDLTSSVDVEEV